MEEPATCDCPGTEEAFSDDSPISFREREICDGPVTEHLDFGKVAVGTRVHKVFIIKNESQHAREYSVQRNPEVNPLYQMFDFAYTSKVQRGQNFECKITYSPQIQPETHIDYLLIFDGSCNIYKLTLKGECIGPAVKFSVNSLVFHCNPEKKSARHTIEVKNLSQVPAIYQFDVSTEKFGVFEMDKICGSLGANKHAYITLSFTPMKFGIYCENVVCLISNHKPYILNLVGMYTEKVVDPQIPQLKYFQQYMACRNGYCGYLCDSVRMTQYPPPFTLSENYLDFGSIVLNKRERNSRTLVTCLTNHMNEAISVIWAEDREKIFQVSPHSVKIPPHDSVLYECEFCPKEVDALYCKLLRGRVFWTDDRNILTGEECHFTNVPLCVTLRLLGSSFPDNRRWIPQIEIPEKVILPPCMPSSRSYTTFVVKAVGYLPVSFRLLPPKKTNFVIKPMVGIVKNFQIVVVQLQADSEDQKAYVERWDVEVNGLANSSLPIFIKGYSETPCIEIGERNVVHFGNTYPGCEETLSVGIKNLSVHHILYKFDSKSDLLEINVPEGRLARNETVYLEWTITGKLKSPRKFKVSCEIRSIEGNIIDGLPLEIPVTVLAECCFSQLCCIPNKHNLNQVQMGSTHTRQYFLFNFGESPIHYQFEIKEKTLKPFDTKNLTIVPNRGTLKPKARQAIMVCLKACQTGRFIIQCSYRVRLNKTSPKIVDKNLYKIFSLTFHCHYAIIKVEDILDSNFGHLFANAYLAEQMYIIRINESLRTIKQGEVKTVDLIMPDYEVNEQTFYAVLILHNMSKFATNIKLKRNKICECPLLHKSNSLTFRSELYDCKHRDMFEMRLSSNDFEPNSYQELTVRIRYLEAGPVTMSYFIHLSHNRTIVLNISYCTLPHRIGKPSRYRPIFYLDMGKVYVHEKESSMQTLPLYNNSADNVWYAVDEPQLKNYEGEHKFKEIDCLNPCGTLVPYSTYMLLFKFRPIKIIKYNFTIDVTMGSDVHKMNIFGEGVAKTNQRRRKCKKSHAFLKCSQKIFKPQTPVKFSESHVKCDPLLAWSSSEKLIFITNITKYRVIGYSFQRGYVEGILEARCLYNKGVLKPQESHAIRIQIISFEQSCKTCVQLPCKLLDHTQYYLHKQSLFAHKRRQEEIKDLFTITEKGTSYPENNVPIVPMPENFYRSLTVGVHIVSSEDVDMHLDVENQMRQSPQFNLQLNADAILVNFRPPPLSVNKPLSSFIIDSMKRDIKVSAKQKGDAIETKRGMSFANIELIKDVIECCIAQVLGSGLFINVLHKMKSATETYYIQFRPDTNQRDSSKDDYETRINVLQTLINPIPALTAANIFKELITDGIHEVFKLGPQKKNQVDSEYIYDSKFKSRYVCKSHKCGCRAE